MQCPSSAHNVVVFDALVFASTALGELKVDALASESLVHLRICVESVVNATPLFLVEYNLEQLLPVLLGAQALANDLYWIDEIVQDGVVDGSEST